MNAVKNLLGKRIKHLREMRHYTQEALSEIVDINPVYLSNIERGKANPSLNLLIKVSHALDVDMWEMFDYKHETTARDLKGMLKVLTNSVKDEGQLKMAVRMLQIITK